MNSTQEPTENPGHFHPSRWFFFACAAESSLGLAAVVLGYLFHQSPVARFHWNLTDAGLGLVATVPPFFLFVGMLKSSPGFLRDVHHAMEQTVRPLFARWSILQLAIISVLAGVGEELLFRGFIQEKLTGSIGSTLALLAASVLFGCVHPITWNYAVVTALVGVYLGGLMLATGNLLSPIVTHAAYDFMALVYFLRVHRKFPRDFP